MMDTGRNGLCICLRVPFPTNVLVTKLVLTRVTCQYETRALVDTEKHSYVSEVTYMNI